VAVRALPPLLNNGVSARQRRVAWCGRRHLARRVGRVPVMVLQEITGVGYVTGMSARARRA